jgi:hypothetical protein
MKSASWFIAAGAAVLLAAPAAAQTSTDPMALLKVFSDYMSVQPSIEARVDTYTEVLTTDLRKVQFNSTGTIWFVRPGKLKVHRVGGYSDAMLIADGTTVTVVDVANRKYSQSPQQGDIDSLANAQGGVSNAVTPGMDLLTSNPYKYLSDNVNTASVIGQAVINGKTCKHLYFETDDADWQLWFQDGPAPMPCKMVITTKMMTLGPQHSITFTDFKASPKIEGKTFEFKPTAGMTMVPLNQLGNLDEVPPPAK